MGKIDDPTAEVTAAETIENGEEPVDNVDVNVEPEEGELNEDEEEEVFYDKQKSFFDSISCEALERSKGNMKRNDWRAEKRLNKETFGVAGNSSDTGGNLCIFRGLYVFRICQAQLFAIMYWNK